MCSLTPFSIAHIAHLLSLANGDFLVQIMLCEECKAWHVKPKETEDGK